MARAENFRCCACFTLPKNVRGTLLYDIRRGETLRVVVCDHRQAMCRAATTNALQKDARLVRASVGRCCVVCFPALNSISLACGVCWCGGPSLGCCATATAGRIYTHICAASLCAERVAAAAAGMLMLRSPPYESEKGAQITNNIQFAMTNQGGTARHRAPLRPATTTKPNL